MRESDGPRPPSREARFGETSRGYGEASPPEDTYGEAGRPEAPYEGPPLFASSSEEPRRRSGLSIWFAAAVSLVLGIVIGFASGYRAGQGTIAATVTEPGTSSPTPTSGASSSGQTFSESTVSDPVAPEPIVPSDVPAGPQRRLGRAAEPAPQAQRPPVGRVPPRPSAVAADPAAPPQTSRPPLERAPLVRPPSERAGAAPPIATGPGSLQVVSRPEGAQVFLDGQPVGRTPLSIADVAPGQHSIRLELPGFNGWATTVEVRAGSPIRVAASLEQ